MLAGVGGKPNPALRRPGSCRGRSAGLARRSPTRQAVWA